jgi:tight adherence protein C
VTLGTATGAFLGLAVGGGLVLTWSRFPVRRRPTLDARLAPYVGELSAESARRRYLQDTRTVTPFPTLERLVRPRLAEGADLLERILGGGTSVRRRLDQSGSVLSLWANVAVTTATWLVLPALVGLRIVMRSEVK